MQKILLISEDEMLLKTRAAVLKITGAEVMPSRPAAALELQARERCEVVVLCHSLKMERRTEMADAIHQRWPETKVLVVSTHGAWSEAETGADAVSSWDPKSLVVRTIELLQQQRLESGSHRIAEPMLKKAHG